jgi:hypothetical protein
MAPPTALATLPLSPRLVARRKRAAPPRLKLLRLAPRLSVLTGNRRGPDWPVIAGGVGAAMADDVVAEDYTPSCA